MQFIKNYFPYLLPVIYYIAVITCIILAFDYDGNIDSDWTLILIGITLPLSIFSLIFMWSLMHGAALGFFTVLYGACGVANAALIFAICKVIQVKFINREKPQSIPS
jgi:hypothetical protein